MASDEDSGSSLSVLDELCVQDLHLLADDLGVGVRLAVDLDLLGAKEAIDTDEITDGASGHGLCHLLVEEDGVVDGLRLGVLCHANDGGVLKSADGCDVACDGHGVVHVMPL